MSTIDRPERRTLPPLVAGQRLDQPTFHERYEAMPPRTWAELIDGVVYMPSPLARRHGWADRNIAYWLGHYCRFTKSIDGCNNVTTILGEAGEVQPDGQLRIPEELGGRTRIVDDYIHGAPELVVEVSRSSRAYDLGVKKREYERSAAPEYLFVGLDPEEVRWFILRDGHYVDLSPGPDGLFRSEIFPGLWLDPAALLAEDLNRLTEVVERGVATPEHAAFVARLAELRADRG